MKLRKIEIENFRGISTPLSFELDDFTTLVGRNDIGKSTILAALTIFLEGDGVDIDKEDGCKKGDSSKVRITCDFSNLPEKIVLDDSFETSFEQENLLLSNGRLRVTKIYNCSTQKIKPPSIYIESDRHYVDAKGSTLLNLNISDLKKKAAEYNVILEKGEATVKAKIRKAIIDRSTDKMFVGKANISLDANEAETLWKQLLKSLPICALFISDRASTDKDREAQSPLQIAVESAISEIQDDLDLHATFIEKRVQEVASRTLVKLKEMNPELANHLEPKLRDKLKWKDIFKYSLISDEGIPMDKRGSGVRRLVLLNFFRAEAERKATKEGGRPVLYAIEEPETAQHPEHQKMLIKALKELSTDNQVIITTHSPGLLAEIEASSIRFLDINEGIKSIRSHSTEDAGLLFIEIGKKMGMLPDNQIRVVVCVEGWNDIRFLSHVSKIYNRSEPSLPDLSADKRFLLLPMRGSNLKDAISMHLFRNLEKPEFHLYDKDTEGTYKEEIEKVNARSDGSLAFETKKRYMESYISSAAIKRVCQVDCIVDDEIDYLPKFSCDIKEKMSIAKAKLADEVVPQMTMEEIEERDKEREIKGWLETLRKMAEHGN